MVSNMFFLKYVMFSIIIFFNFVSSCERTSIKANFPPFGPSSFPLLRSMETLPLLQEFTACSWVRLSSLNNALAVIISYATADQNNEFILSLAKANNKTVVRLYVRDGSLDVGCSSVRWELGTWYHLCVSWFGTNGVTKVFVNGAQCSDGSTNVVSAGKHIRTGGVLIIGQEQDEVDSKFDKLQAWYGDIADLQIWNEVLNEVQMQEVGKCKGKRRIGNVFSWMKTPVVSFDGVMFSETELCQF